MSDGAYALVDALTVIALIFVLWHRFKYAQGIRRLRKMLAEQGITDEKLKELAERDK